VIALIPTKGRPETSTYKLLEASGFTVYHFVEPQELSDYDVPNKINIEQNNQGISYVRNFMLSFARKQALKHVLILDDDINAFGTAKSGKSVKQPNADALLKPMNIFMKSEFAIGGFNLRQFAWSEKKPYRVNTGKAEGCILCSIDRIKWDYESDTKEDRDFMMRCLDNRESFVYFCKTFYNTPAIGSNKGGLNDFYQAKRDAVWAQKVAKAWPEYSTLIKQYGRTDVKLDYKKKAHDMGLKVV
tara:strand:+ start:579 stop:1310 length:732 start_codon:yes stop_codon:yes gene_type:complete